MTKSGFTLKLLAAFLTFSATIGLGWATWADDTTGESRTFPEPRRVVDREEQAASIGIRTGLSGTEGSYDNALDWGAEAAFQQILDRDYLKKYIGSPKTIVGIGINFDKDRREIDWVDKVLR